MRSNAAVTYDIPTPEVAQVGKAILGNWGIDTFVTARSATPVNLIGRSGFIGAIRTRARPDVVPGVPFYLDDPNVPGGRRFNPAAFTVPPAGRQGTLGRNVVRGFAVSQVDLALRRRFDLTGHVKLQFRWGAFNVFNRPNFGDPCCFAGEFLSSALFGQSILMLGRSLGTGGAEGGFNPLYQVGGPRSMQFAFKLTF